MKKVFLAIIFLLVLLIGAAIALPFVFRDDIIKAVKNAANENLNASLDFSDVDISLFRDFPNVSVGLEDLIISGKEDFKGIDLIKAKRFDLALDFWSAWNGGNPLKINGITINQPELNIYVLQNGKANYDITKPSEGESADYIINLDEYTINDGSFYYEDRGLNFIMDLDGIDHVGSGDITASIYDLKTKTEAESMTTSFDGISYFNKVKADLDALIHVDLDKMKFTLKDNDLKINALKLLVEGWVQLGEADINMDLKFDAPSNSFKEFLSLVPGAYSADYKNVKANGTFAFNAAVKGKYNGEKEQMPVFNLNLDLKNGDFKYPDLPMPVSGINAKVKVNSPSANLDRMTVSIPNFKMKMGTNPIEGYFNLKTPQSDPDVDGKFKGKLNLADLSKAMPMEGVKKITGMVDADVELDAKMSQLDRKNYDNVKAKGYFNIINMEYEADEMPPVRIKKMNTTLSPKQLILKDFDVKAGKSDFKGKGTIDNVLAYFSDDKTMKGDMYVRSGILDLNEWISEEETAESPDENTEVFDRFDFELDGQADIIRYEDYKLLNTIAKGNMTSNKLEIDKFSTKVGKSDIQAKGEVRNIFDYLFENGTIHGEVDLAGNFLDLNELMGTTEASTKELAEPILVPEKIDMTFNSDIDRVLYDDMDLRDVRGKLNVKDEAVSMKNIKTKSLGGTIAFTGKYDTKDKEEPLFEFDNKLTSIDFKKAFNTFNTFQKFAPIGKFLSGSFSSDLKMDGILGKDMIPDLKNLNSEGYLETLNGLISGFQPLNSVGNLLNINELKSTNLKELKTWFTIKDGKIAVEEFPFSAHGIDFKMAGAHGLDQAMDYGIKAKIPRRLLEKNSVTSAANKGLQLISKEAKKVGIDLGNGDFVNVLIKVTGSMTDPKTSLKVLGTEDGESLDIVSSVKQQVETKVKEEVQEVKDEVKTRVNEEKEDLKAKADAEIAEVMKKAETAAGKIRKEGENAAKKAKDFGYAQAEKLENASKNPLKKVAAKIAADKLRKETDEKSARIKIEADKKADQVIAAAEKQAEKIRAKYKDK